MSEEIAQAAADIAYWKQRAEQAELMLAQTKVDCASVRLAYDQAKRQIEAEQSARRDAIAERNADEIELNAARAVVDAARAAIRVGWLIQSVRETVEEYDRAKVKTD